MALRRAALLAALLFLADAAGPPQAAAQYFGQNVVRYHRFEFQVLATEHFDIHYYYPEGHTGADVEVQRAALLAERWYARLSRLLSYELSGRQPLILYANHPQFRQTNAVPGGIGEGTGGVTEAFKRRIVLPFGGSLAATDHVIGHELVHAFQFDMTGERGGISGLPGALGLPLWFIEGMAEYLAVGPIDSQTAMWMRDAVLREDLPSIRDLDAPRIFPYRYGHAFWAYVAGEYGDRTIGTILLAAGRLGDPLVAIEDVLGVPIDELSDAWHEALRAAYEPIVRGVPEPGDVARALLTEETTGGEINVGPSVSPDGTRVVFLSERDLFSIDLFLADAETGAVIRRLIHTAVDPHFDSLQFIASAGGWHPDGRRFVLATVVGGEPALTIVDTESGRTVREVRLDGLGEAFNPAFSPDGRRIAFSASPTGVTNLFVYDVEEDAVSRLTDDGYAAQGPVWSPDGRTLAFATDRFTTLLDTLHPGALQIGLIDVETGAIRRVAGFDRATHINPQWSRDGRSLFFIADRDGMPNAYRTDLATGETRQITRLATGVSGITTESPALSVAAATDRLLFSAFEGGRYGVYAIDGDRLQGEALAASPAGEHAAALPPRREGRGGDVSAWLQQPEVGLPKVRDFPAAPYNAGLSLDFVGQPAVSVGADQFGTFAGGGVSFVFSDMLGNHQLATAVQINGGLRDIGGLVGYQNLSRRINWGVTLQRVPLRTGGVSQELASVDGQSVLVERVFFDREIHNILSGVVSYPFSRATRVEFAAGMTHLTFDREVETRVISLQTGGLLVGDRQPISSLPGLTYGQGSAAIVYDTSIFGAAGPILGRRARLEVGQTAGSLQLSTLLADYRQYAMLFRPFTLAGRILHVGRYGGDADDPRLFPFFIGYQSLVRGYDIWLLDAGEGALMNRLTGSRALVANLEMRFPLLGLFTRTFYGPFPVEGVVFADAGTAWSRGKSPRVFGGTVAPVASAGAGVRANLLGVAIVEIDIVRPFNRPLERWVWQFGFTPGF